MVIILILLPNDVALGLRLVHRYFAKTHISSICPLDSLRL
jgi:hypothetical protein